jgi:hypothetical protein
VRLGPGGIFLSHCHDGGSRPPAESFHATAELFRKAGGTISGGRELPERTGRIAWLVTSTKTSSERLQRTWPSLAG